ncbi:hypothetical protein BFU36_11955 [Sulfolobus sp. A20]|nr:hypothetical protein BFU36_11955 [Sulfolobus sp. A20]
MVDSGYLIKHASSYDILLCEDDLCFHTLPYTSGNYLTIYEIFEIKTYDIEVSGVVIDIGAEIGDSSIYFAINGASKVIGLEVNPILAKIAIKNIETNGLNDKVIILPYAIGSIDSETTFGSTKVKQITFNTLVSIYNIKNIDLVKIDCEGCEYDIIPTLPFQIINKIIMEYHDYPQFIPTILTQAGFIVKYDKNKRIGILRAYKEKT